MSTSTALYAQSVIDAFRIAPKKPAEAQSEKAAAPKVSAKLTNQPTIFHRCLAVHMFAAERAGALD
jgi:hypothetical protein